MNIREAQSSDLSTLKQFEQGIIEAERPFDNWLKSSDTHYYDIPAFIADDNTRLIVVEHDDELVGCGYAQIRESKEAHVQDYHAYVGFIYVSPAHRGKGINKRIMDDLFTWSESRGVSDITLDVYFTNESAIRAYQKAGFEPSSIHMRRTKGDC